MHLFLGRARWISGSPYDETGQPLCAGIRCTPAIRREKMFNVKMNIIKPELLSCCFDALEQAILNSLIR